MSRCLVPAPPPILTALALLAVALIGCGPGFEGYEDFYPEPDAGPPPELWEGPEQVEVACAAGQDPAQVTARVLVALAGLPTMPFEGATAVSLAAVVQAAAIVEGPDQRRYDFTATDGYDLLVKRGTPDKLPGWADLAIGVLYLHLGGDLRVGWDAQQQPWGSALSAYQLKLMDRGRITALAPP